MSSSVSFDAIVDALRDPGAYPWSPDSVEVIETHISWVFLAGDRVLKLKRPVDYGFVDYSTLELRRSACEDEVRLNRRLSNGVYLGVADITTEDGRITVDGNGDAVEYGTLMRRLPADGMLDRMMERGQIDTNILDRIADRLIEFHRTIAEQCNEGPGSAKQQMKVVLDNLNDLQPFADNPLPPVQLEAVVSSMREFCNQGNDVLTKRVNQGWIREGHGDLRTDHICLDQNGEIQIFDCVEFSQGIRCADVASDLAFLLVDLDRLGASSVASTLTERYRSSGIDLPDPILRFYRGHRALVKVKVSLISWRDLPADHRLQFFEEAMTYLDLALAAITELQPVMIAMTGLSGTGKSVVASALARALGAPVLSTDELRQQISTDEEPPTGWETGRYTPSNRSSVYEELFRRGTETVRRGKPVILDATFLEASAKESAVVAARDAGVPILFVETVADSDVVRRRLNARSKRGDSKSEATVDIYQQQLQRMYESPQHLPVGAEHVRVDTSQDGPVNLDDVHSLLIERAILRPGIAVT